MQRTDSHQKGMFDIQSLCIDGSMPNGKWTVRIEGHIPSTKGTTQPESDATKSVLRSLRRGFGVNYSSTISWVMGFWERKNLKLCACIRLARQTLLSSLQKNWDSLQWVQEYGAVFWGAIVILEPADDFHRFPWTHSPISSPMNALRAFVGKLPPILLSRNKADDNSCCLE